ncbi:c-type cytochrome [Nitratifractor sp.]
MDERNFERAIVAVSLLIVGIGIFRALHHASDRKHPSAPPAEERNVSVAFVHPSGIRPDSPEGIYRYVVDVIEHGSARFHFPGGTMEGGYLPPAEARKVACYVLQLGGHRCPVPPSPDAQMYYTGACAGCHGSDGKGLGGRYPDLTRPRLLGIEEALRKRSLSSGGNGTQ